MPVWRSPVRHFFTPVNGAAVRCAITRPLSSPASFPHQRAPLAVRRDLLERRQLLALLLLFLNGPPEEAAFPVQHGGVVRRARTGNGPINHFLIGLRDALVVRNAF